VGVAGALVAVGVAGTSGALGLGVGVRVGEADKAAADVAVGNTAAGVAVGNTAGGMAVGAGPHAARRHTPSQTSTRPRHDQPLDNVNLLTVTWIPSTAVGCVPRGSTWPLGRALSQGAGDAAASVERIRLAHCNTRAPNGTTRPFLRRCAHLVQGPSPSGPSGAVATPEDTQSPRAPGSLGCEMGPVILAKGR
jgi:hypothetical protein